MRRARAARRRVLEADLAPPMRLDLEAALDALDQELAALEREPPGPALEQRLAALRGLADELEQRLAALRGLADELEAAPPPQPEPAGEDRVQAARRRVAAARAAAAEVGRAR